tara:strand:- start:3224 stop:3562 length:339 start_codon:yes stop_codon:yes gene_type:complete
MPDVYMIWDGFPVWIELKVITGNAVKLSPQQVAWHGAHSHAGGLSFILVKRSKDSGLFLFEGCHGRSVASEGVACVQGSRFEALGPVFEAIREVSIRHWSKALESCGSAALL